VDNEPAGLEHGDRVVSSRDLDTTQGLHVPKGAVGTVTEDRGSHLVVFFDTDAVVARVDEQDLVRQAA
jgi:hypothetical protein